MEEKKIEKDKKILVKKVYTPPMLTIYGKLTELTGGGTAGSLEAGNPGQKMLQVTKRA